MIDRDMPAGACVLLGAELAVMHMSRAAQALLRDSAVLTVRQHRLHAPDNLLALNRCLTRAARGERTALALPRPGQAALTLRAEPRRAGDGCQVLVVLRDPDLEAPAPALLQSLFGLTVTESLVAAGLARGDSSAELALRMGVQPNTVLSHIKRVLLKSGTRRQSQLVSLILRSAAMPHPWLAGDGVPQGPGLAQTGDDGTTDAGHSDRSARLANGEPG